MSECSWAGGSGRVWNKKRSPLFPYCPVSCQCTWKEKYGLRLLEILESIPTHLTRYREGLLRPTGQGRTHVIINMAGLDTEAQLQVTCEDLRHFKVIMIVVIINHFFRKCHQIDLCISSLESLAIRVSYGTGLLFYLYLTNCLEAFDTIESLFIILSYLSDWWQHVKIDSSFSSWSKLANSRSSIIQGSVLLCPLLLFNIYLAKWFIFCSQRYWSL